MAFAGQVFTQAEQAMHLLWSIGRGVPVSSRVMALTGQTSAHAPQEKQTLWFIFGLAGEAVFSVGVGSGSGVSCFWTETGVMVIALCGHSAAHLPQPAQREVSGDALSESSSFIAFAGQAEIQIPQPTQ